MGARLNSAQVPTSPRLCSRSAPTTYPILSLISSVSGDCPGGSMNVFRSLTCARRSKAGVRSSSHIGTDLPSRRASDRSVSVNGDKLNPSPRSAFGTSLSRFRRGTINCHSMSGWLPASAGPGVNGAGRKTCEELAGLTVGSSAASRASEASGPSESEGGEGC
jgi:hypothetical protein